MSAKSVIETKFPADHTDLSEAHWKKLLEAAPRVALGTYKSGGLTSKMWLLPDGQLQPLNCWHWDWLKQHPDTAQKFGLNLQGIPDTEQAVRLAALNHGFVRINYEHKNGTLTVEALAKFWSRDVKDTIFMLVADNLSRIDNIVVNLLSDTGGIMRRGSAQLFSLDSDEEKLNSIPLVSESQRGRALKEHINTMLRLSRERALGGKR